MKGKPAEPYPKIYLYRRLVQAKIFIDDHFAEPIDIDNMADEATFSKCHFIRLFKTTYGKSPHQYLTSVRIEKAKQLLQTDITIAEACEQVGFNSITSFAGLFKRTTGLTPSAYQQQQQMRNGEIREQPLKFIPNCFAETKGWR